MAVAQSLLMGLRQFGRRISIRHLFPLRKPGGDLHLAIPAEFCTAGSRPFDAASIGPWRGLFSARARAKFVPASGPARSSGGNAQWLDHLLECERLVWVIGRFCLASMGLVGNGARA